MHEPVAICFILRFQYNSVKPGCIALRLLSNCYFIGIPLWTPQTFFPVVEMIHAKRSIPNGLNAGTKATIGRQFYSSVRSAAAPTRGHSWGSQIGKAQRCVPLCPACHSCYRQNKVYALYQEYALPIGAPPLIIIKNKADTIYSSN